MSDQALLEIQQKLKRLSPETIDAFMNEASQIAWERVQKKKNRFRQFQAKYRGNPVKFMKDCIKWENRDGSEGGLFDYQESIIDEFNQHSKLALRGPRDLGKTAMAALLTLYWALVYDGEDWKVVQSASVFRQLEKVLWPEIHKWARKLRWDVIGREPFNPRTELLRTNLKLSTGEAFPISSDNPDATEGVHADFLLYIFDESKIIEGQFWDSVEGALSDADQEYKWLAISTPGDMSTRFYQIHARKPGYEDWQVRHVTIDEVVSAGRRTWEWVEQRKRQWGENSQLFFNHVLGEFKESDENAVIPLAFIEGANQRYDDWQDRVRNGSPLGQLTHLGVDIGLGGKEGDRTNYAKVYDDVLVAELQRESRGGSVDILMQVTGKIKGFIDAHNCLASVDVIGLGAGVVSRLNEQGLSDRVQAFSASRKPSKKIKDQSKMYTFVDSRSAMWWLAREMLDPDSGYDIALPRDDILIGELTAPTSQIMSDAKIKVESKKDIRKRLGRSTDSADAVLQALVAAQKLSLGGNTKIYVVGQGEVSF
jgi:hypothetical protein